MISTIQMDEYNSGMDKEVKRYFRKIINSFSVGLMWMLSTATTGLFFGLAVIEKGWRWYNVVYYVLAVITFFLLLYYFFKVWRKNDAA